MTPTARTLAELRRNGWTCQTVEYWNAFTKRRRDLFSVIDIVAVRADAPGCFGVQATSAANISARLTKARNTPELRTWLQAGNRFAVVGWAKRRATVRNLFGKEKRGRELWQPIWREVTLETLAAAEGVPI